MSKQLQSSELKMSSSAWFWLIMLSIVWGGSFFFIEVCLRDLPTLTIVFFRVLLAAIALYIYLAITRTPMPTDPKIWRDFFGMGFLNNLVPFSLIVYGQTFIESGLASILNATMPIFTVILAHFLTRDERINSGKLLGVILGLIGVITLIGPEALKGFTGNVTGQLAVLAGAVSYAFAGIFGKRFRGIPSSVTATGMLTCSAIMLAPIVAFVDKPWQYSPSIVTIAALLGLAVLSTAIAYLMFFYVLNVGGATNVSLVTLLIPVSAVLLGALILGERLQWTAFAGMGFIILGLLAINGKLFQLFGRR